MEKLPLTPLYSGKVRDLYRLSDKELLMVASDRISAFDYILPTPVPELSAEIVANTRNKYQQIYKILTT